MIFFERIGWKHVGWDPKKIAPWKLTFCELIGGKYLSGKN
jgi:hypothetical protein